MRTLLLLCALMLGAWSSGAEARLLSADLVREPESLLPYFSWLPDADGSLSIETINSGSLEERFAPLSDGIPLKGAGPVWIRLAMIKQTPGGAGLSRPAESARLVMNLGALPPGGARFYVSQSPGPIDAAGVWHGEDVASHEPVLLPDPGLLPMSVYIRLDEMPGLWFAPTVAPQNAAAPDLLPSELILPGLIIAAAIACLLRALAEKAAWAVWSAAFLGCCLAQAVLPLPALSKGLSFAALPPLVAPGLALILLPHVGRCIFRTDRGEPLKDALLYLCSFAGLVLTLAPLLPGFQWLTRLFPLWPLLLAPLLPLCLAVSGRPGALAYAGACFMPVLGAAVSLYALTNPALHPLAAQGSLWGLAVGGIGLALARVPAPEQEQEEQEPGLALAETAASEAKAKAEGRGLQLVDTTAFAAQSQYDELPPLPVEQAGGTKALLEAEAEGGAEAKLGADALPEPDADDGADRPENPGLPDLTGAPDGLGAPAGQAFPGEEGATAERPAPLESDAMPRQPLPESLQPDFADADADINADASGGTRPEAEAASNTDAGSAFNADADAAARPFDPAAVDTLAVVQQAPAQAAAFSESEAAWSEPAPLEPETGSDPDADTAATPEQPLADTPEPGPDAVSAPGPDSAAPEFAAHPESEQAAVCAPENADQPFAGDSAATAAFAGQPAAAAGAMPAARILILEDDTPEFGPDFGSGAEPEFGPGAGSNAGYDAAAEPDEPAGPARPGMEALRVSSALLPDFAGNSSVEDTLSDTGYRVISLDDADFSAFVPQPSAQQPDTPYDDMDDFSPNAPARTTSLTDDGLYLFSLHSLVRDVHDIVEPLAKARGLIFSWYIAPALPSLLEGDAPRLRGALSLLLQSAVRATTKGAVQLTVRKAPGASDPGEMLFVISDNGSAKRTDAGFFHAWELAALTGGSFTVDYSPTSGTQISFTARFALPSEQAAQDHLARYPLDDADDPLADAAFDPAHDARQAMAQGHPEPLSGLGSAVHASPAAPAPDEDPVPVLHTVTTTNFAVATHAAQAARTAQSNKYQTAHPSQAPQATEYEAAWLAALSPEQVLADQIAAVKKSLAAGQANGQEQPLGEAPLSAPDATNRPMPAQDQAAGEQPLPIILVAEMTTSNRRLLASYLADVPHEHLNAENNQDVLEYAQAKNVSLIIFDADMPEPDIIRTITELRQAESIRDTRTPILVLTSHTAQTARMLEAGASYTLCKPYRKQSLRDMVALAVPSLTQYVLSLDTSPPAKAAPSRHDTSGAKAQASKTPPLKSAVPPAAPESLPPSFAPAEASPMMVKHAPVAEREVDLLAEALKDAPEPAATSKEVVLPPRYVHEEDRQPPQHGHEIAAPLSLDESRPVAAPFLMGLSSEDVTPVAPPEGKGNDVASAGGSLLDFILPDDVSLPAEGEAASPEAAAVSTKTHAPDAFAQATETRTAELEEAGVVQSAAPELTDEPTAEPAPEPTAEPAPEPTAEPAPEPTAEPAPAPGQAVALDSADHTMAPAAVDAQPEAVPAFADAEQKPAAEQDDAKQRQATDAPQQEPGDQDAALADNDAGLPAPASVPAAAAVPAAAPAPAAAAAPLKAPKPPRVVVSVGPVRKRPEPAATDTTATVQTAAQKPATPMDTVAVVTPIQEPALTQAANAPAQDVTPAPAQETSVAPAQDVTPAQAQDAAAAKVADTPVKEAAADSAAGQDSSSAAAPPTDFFALPGIEGEGLDPEALPLIPGLLHTLEEALTDILAAREQGNSILVQEAASRLAGKAEHFDLTKLGKFARCVERAAEAGDMEAVQTLLEDLAPVIRRYMAALDQCFKAFLNFDR